MSALETFLSTHGIRFKAEGGVLTQRDGWDCYQWRITLGSEGFDFFTGTGCIEKGRRYLAFSSPVPVRPKADDVLPSLVGDSQAKLQSFSDWADEYGYSSDSLKAFDTYRACCAIADQLAKIFTQEQLKALAKIIEEQQL